VLGVAVCAVLAGARSLAAIGEWATDAPGPVLARELRIGRPDVPRQFDDGGLVDLNHAPVPVLV
jgi:hypothetical protein